MGGNLQKREESANIDHPHWNDNKASIAFGMRMVDEGCVEYSPQNKAQVISETGPTDQQERQDLKTKIMPALELTKAYAQSIWNSEPATIERTLNEDPELFDVEGSHDIDKNADPDDALHYNIKVTMRNTDAPQSATMQALVRTVETLGDKIGAAVIRRARKTLRTEFELLQTYQTALLEAGVSVKDPALRQRIAGAQVGLQGSLKSPPFVMEPRKKKPETGANQDQRLREVGMGSSDKT